MGLVVPAIIGVQNPLECTIVQRFSRFVVEVLVEGCPQRAWINNTGRGDLTVEL